MKRTFASVLSAIGVCVASTQASVIIDTDFSSASTGDITSSGTIANTGGLYGQASATDYLTIDTVNGSNALSFTKTSATASNVPTVYRTITGASTGPTGDNFITGNFNLTRTDTGNGQLSFLINAGSATTSGATVTAVSLAIRTSDGRLEYTNGSSTVYSSNLALNNEYQFNISLDSSSTTQDLWRLSIVNVTTATSFLDTGWINTRAANITPGILVWNAGSSTANSVSPNIAINSMSFDLVPEPSAMGLAAAGFGFLMLRRRNRSAAVKA